VLAAISHVSPHDEESQKHAPFEHTPAPLQIHSFVTPPTVAILFGHALVHVGLPR
jgi:hypothetical protein